MVAVGVYVGVGVRVPVGVGVGVSHEQMSSTPAPTVEVEHAELRQKPKAQKLDRQSLSLPQTALHCSRCGVLVGVGVRVGVRVTVGVNVTVGVMVLVAVAVGVGVSQEQVDKTPAPVVESVQSILRQRPIKQVPDAQSSPVLHIALHSNNSGVLVTVGVAVALPD